MNFTTRQQAIGVNTYHLSYLKADSNLKKINERVLQEGITIEAEEVVEDLATGHTRYFLTTKSPLLDNKKNIIGIQGYAKEVPQYKLALAKIQQTEWLHQQERQKRNVVTLHSGSMAHDLKLPLQKANLAIEMAIMTLERAKNAEISSDKAYQDAMRHLNTVIRSNTEMDELIQQANQIIQQETSEVDAVVLTPIAVHKLVQKSLAYFEQDVAEGLITVKVAHEAVLKVDELGFMRVMMNLIDNAKRAINQKNKGKIYVTADFVDTTAPEKGYFFEIKDTAGGLSLAEIEGIFERYKTKEVTGTGLGLQHARHWVAAMGGQLSAHFQAPDCIAFRITLYQFC